MDLDVLSEHPDAPPSSTDAAASPPLLFVHGAWHGAWCWADHFLPYFAAHGYDAYALSLRGHAGSPTETPLRWLRIRDYADDLAAVAASLPRRPVLIGHSMGGFVVQRYLETRSAAGAILLASVPPSGALGTLWQVARRAPGALVEALLTLRLAPVVGTPERTRRLLLTDETPQSTVDSVHRRLQDESVRAFLDMLLLDLPPARPRPVPALVLGSDSDPLVGRSATEETARAFGTAPVTVSGPGHDMMLGPSWRAVADRVLAWLDAQDLQ